MKKQRGFTLVELGVVLGVLSILVAVVAPNFIEVSRVELGEQAAQEVVTLIDAAKNYYAESCPTSPAQMSFPGDATDTGGNPGPDWIEDSENAAENCLVGAGQRYDCGDPVLGILPSVQPCQAVIPSTALTNPWGQRYQIEISGLPLYDTVPVGDHAENAMWIATNVPVSVAGIMRSYLPNGECQGDAGVEFCNRPGLDFIPVGMTRCCGMIPRPGVEASVGAMGITPAACASVGGVYVSQGECNLFQADPAGPGGPETCTWRTGNPAFCEGNEVQRGSECAGKYCSQIRIQCCTAVDPTP